MALVKLGSVKKTDLVVSGSVNLSTDVGSSVLPVANGGTGSGSFTNGQLLIGNTSGNTLTKATLTGTADQVVVTNGGGSITLSLPQSIATTSSPTFNFLQLTDLTTTNNITVNGITFGAGLTAALGCVSAGAGALASNTSGTLNTAVGNSAINAMTNGSDNVAVGNGAGSYLTTGSHSVVIGTGAAQLNGSASNVTAINQCVVVGDSARLSTVSSDTNAIVIGYDARGRGSNTSVIGNTSTTASYVYGSLAVGNSFLATLDPSSLTANRTITIPDSAGTLVLGGGSCSGSCSGTNTGDQTSVSGNAGTATVLQTARAIYGNNFDGSAALTQVIASTYGGTGNGFTKFSGPTTAERTKTLRDANDTILELGGSYTPTGTWTSLTMVTPALGTPTSGTLTNCTGLPVSSGISGLGTGVATFLATPSSANLASAMTTKTGSGNVVFSGSATLTNSIINQAADGDTAIKSVRFTDTSPTGNFLDFQSAAASSIFSVDRFGKQTVLVTAQASTAETLFSFGVSDSATRFTLSNGTANDSQFNPTFNGVTEQGIDGVAISFFGTKGVSTATNPAILFLGRYNSGAGNTDLPATVPLCEFRNRATSLVYVYGNGDLKLIGSGATLGYGTGSGGTVTQATSKSTGVTLSKGTGQITLNNAALAANTTVSFTLTNTLIAATDVLVMNHISGGTAGAYTLNAQCAAGSASINVRNVTAGSLSEAIVIQFVVIKGVTA